MICGVSVIWGSQNGCIEFKVWVFTVYSIHFHYKLQGFYVNCGVVWVSELWVFALLVAWSVCGFYFWSWVLVCELKVEDFGTDCRSVG